MPKSIPISNPKPMIDTSYIEKYVIHVLLCTNKHVNDTINVLIFQRYDIAFILQIGVKL